MELQNEPWHGTPRSLLVPMYSCLLTESASEGGGVTLIPSGMVGLIQPGDTI